MLNDTSAQDEPCIFQLQVCIEMEYYVHCYPLFLDKSSDSVFSKLNCGQLGFWKKKVKWLLRQQIKVYMSVESWI